MEHPQDIVVQRRLDNFERLLTSLRGKLTEIQEGHAGADQAKNSYQAAGEGVAAADACRQETRTDNSIMVKIWSDLEDKFVALQNEFRKLM